MNGNTLSSSTEKETQIRALRERMAKRKAEMDADMQMLQRLEG